MSTIKQPLGRQSSKVYRRRRLVALLGLLLVAVVITLVIVKPGASSGEPGAGSGASPASTATDASASPAPSAAATVDGAPCDAGNVAIEALTDKSTYESGELPQLSLSLTNNGSNACAINAGTAQQVFTVTSGNDTYWTSTDCQTDAADSEVTLKPGVTVSSSTPIAWDRTRSAAGTCEDPTREAAPGGGASYFLNVTVDGIASTSPKQILLY
ncbi:hypothetical protein [Cryobacterium psychrophilum]|uniref:Uncharacterized protein n=1 Tax=Cryobacterium psychrophilum TaxID=41988 RepID=A0A4Y8KTV5_9MICO|nr:hypothetical protein [Cryobacterium psychrophilum]TDW29903.1 hypothetical protein EDD25_1624 [Cryobacterium psychrophilum]TFD80238.1 hypothetical protein E3T53_05675 [Cryobacterium psychrophilum]